MARDVGVLDVHAEYGASQVNPEYGLLQRVSHWTEQDIKRENEIITKGHNFEPSVVLKGSFSEIFMHCDFQSFSSNKSDLSLVDNQFALETWKKTVDVQKHFNDLQLRVRNYSIVLIGAMIAAIGFTFKLNMETVIFGFTMPTGIIFVIASLFAWAAFYIFDFGYHSLLKGDVNHAAKIEQKYDGKIPGIGLGITISHASKNAKYFGLKLNSTIRLTLYYLLGGLMLVLLLIGLSISSAEQETDNENKNADIEKYELK
ncbi:MAG: hypothetical protein HRU29_05070 [Rhizobiales bacterium]|nr:hypothetical protein [Hyphomicrobiales bacterium]NRB13755.1 hypothetical protein [Hyphomicrobiales bacterium]